jgi:hypothetical protein
MQAKTKIMSKIAELVPRAFAIDIAKLSEVSVFSWTTPRTAQLVVMSGR